METENEINEDIIKTALCIQDNFPELSKFIAEMPVTIPNEARPEITAQNLQEYSNSLTELVTKYSNEKGKMSTKRIGVYLDHANARLINFENGKWITKIIESTFTHDIKEETLPEGEKRMHNKEQHRELAYYKDIASAIAAYQEVLLFGPTGAKVELFNYLKTDRHFDKTDIETRQTDRLTENQEHAFIKDYFFSHS
jgi:hypothetical protein